MSSSVRLYLCRHRAHYAPPPPTRRRRDFFSDLDYHAKVIAWGCLCILFAVAIGFIP
jgi:hypothetical protein